MSIINTDEFYAARQANGDVWIHTASNSTRIPKQYCHELAALLLSNSEEQHDNKVDYSRCAGEPE